MAATNLRPKQLTSDYLPGLGDQHEVGAEGLGVTIISTTIGMSNMADGAIISNAPNTAAGQNAPVVIVHSLGVAPSFVIVQTRATSLRALFNVMTADKSAVYLRATPPQTEPSAVYGLGVAARVIVVR